MYLFSLILNEENKNVINAPPAPTQDQMNWLKKLKFYRRGHQPSVSDIDSTVTMFPSVLMF